MERKKQVIEKTAEFYFGDRKVEERAEDENEFEGTRTTEEDMEEINNQNQLLAKMVSKFWNNIFVKITSWCRDTSIQCVVDDGGNRCVEIYFRRSCLDLNRLPFNKCQPRLFESILNEEEAVKKQWEWPRHVVLIYEIGGPTDLEAVSTPMRTNWKKGILIVIKAILAYLLKDDGLDFRGTYIRTNEEDPRIESTCPDWATFWSEVVGVKCPLEKWKGKPMRFATMGGGGTVIVQRSEKVYYAVEFHIQYERRINFQ
jgi:hypothetical protein